MEFSDLNRYVIKITDKQSSERGKPFCKNKGRVREDGGSSNKRNVIYLASSNNIEVFRQDIDKFPFSFVPPLATKHSRHLTQRTNSFHQLTILCSLPHRHRSRSWSENLRPFSSSRPLKIPLINAGR